MVQVDIAWAYGLGSGFAVAAQRQLVEQTKERWRAGFTTWPFLQLMGVVTLLITSSVHMLWAYPSWQTMHVADVSMPAWLVPAILTVTVAMAVLGYGLSLQLIRRNRPYLAFLQFMAGYFFLFFGSTHGWDGTGYQRTFSATTEEFLTWSWSNFSVWAQSEIAVIFQSYAIVLIPLLFYLASYWIKRGYLTHVSQAKIIAQLAFVILGIVLGSAILITLCLEYFDLWGWLIALAYVYVLVHRRWGVLRWMYDSIFAPLQRTRPTD